MASLEMPKKKEFWILEFALVSLITVCLRSRDGAKTVHALPRPIGSTGH